MNTKHYILLFFQLLMLTSIFAQNKVEREFRIKKNQFPETALALINEQIFEYKKLRFYKEIDTTAIWYSAKFKKDRLHYYLNFNEDGQLLSSGFRIHEIDIPEETNAKIKTYLNTQFNKVKVGRIWQEYARSSFNNKTELLKNTLQNLILPDNTYKLLITGSKQKAKKDYYLFYNAEGNLITQKEALPLNTSRILF